MILYRAPTRSAVQFLLAIIVAICSGCLGLNDVKPIGLAFKGMPPADRAYVIVGLSVEPTQLKRLDYMFSISVAEYSVERQDITGNCWRYNLMYPSVPPFGGTREYFAYDVKPGYYAVLDMLGASEKQSLAFEVPAGRIVYLGEFTLTSSHGISLNRDPSVVRGHFPGREVLLADTREVLRPHGAVCVGP